MIAISSVHRPFTVGRPRRSALLSTESSWMIAAACTISITVAHTTASSPAWPRSRATSSSIVGRNFLPWVASTCPPTSFRIGIGVRNASRSRPWTRSNSRQTGFWTAEMLVMGRVPVRERRGGAIKVAGTPQDRGASENVSSACAGPGDRAAAFREALEQPVARVAARIVEHFLQQRFERLSHRGAGRDAERIHHVAAADREIGDLERARFRENPVDAGAHLREVGREALFQAVAEHVGDAQVEEVGDVLLSHAPEPAPEPGVAPAAAVVEHVLADQVDDRRALFVWKAQALEQAV